MDYLSLRFFSTCTCMSMDVCVCVCVCVFKIWVIVVVGERSQSKCDRRITTICEGWRKNEGFGTHMHTYGASRNSRLFYFFGNSAQPAKKRSNNTQKLPSFFFFLFSFSFSSRFLSLSPSSFLRVGSIICSEIGKAQEE